MNKFIYYNEFTNKIETPAKFLKEGIALAKQKGCGLSIKYCVVEISLEERRSLDEEPTILDFSTLNLYSDLPELGVYDIPKNTTIKNIDYIYLMKNLKIFVISNKNIYGIDASKIPNLTNLAADPCTPKHIFNIGQAHKLEVLKLWGYKGKDLSEFENLTNLTTLELINPSIHTLNGIENLVNLKWLVLYGTRNLTDISLLKKLPNLFYLDLPKKFEKEMGKIKELIKRRHINKG